jgi:O-antigen/teichoic acid export membrane protein
LVWLSIAQVARRFSGLAITVVLARLLAPADYGLMAMATVALGLLANVSDMGVATALVQRDRITPALTSTAFWGGLGLSTLILAGGWLASPLLGAAFPDPQAVSVFQALLISLPLSSLGQVPDALLQREMRFKALSIIEWVSSILSGGLGVASAYLGYGVWALVVQSLSYGLFTAVAKASVARWHPGVTFDRTLARSLFTFGGFVVASMLVNHVAGSADNAIIGARLGATALGYYAMAYTLALMPSGIIIGLVGRVLFPVLSSVKDDPHRLAEAYLRTLRSLTLLTLPAMAAVAVLAPDIVALVYGTKWAPSVPLLQVLCVVGAAHACNLTGLVLFAVGKPHLMMAWGTASAVSMVGGFLVGLHWGVMGVATANAVITIFVVGGPTVHVNQIIGVGGRTFLRSLAPGLAGALIVALLLAGSRLWMPALEASLIVRVALGCVAAGLGYAGFLLGWGRANGVPLRGIIRWSTQV